MSPRRPLILIAFAALLASAEARAHFLFVRIGPMAEAGRSAEVYFSEQAEAGDPKFVDKIAHTALWLQTRPGTFERLAVVKASDRLRAAVPSGGSVVVVGSCEYGVLARPNQTPFLLRYYPKAMAGRADELNRMKPKAEIPFEIVANVEGDRIQLKAGVVFINGTPVERQRVPDFVGRDSCGPSFPGAPPAPPVRVEQWRETLPNGASYNTLECPFHSEKHDTGVYTVPPGHFFMMGDNRENSEDSRYPDVSYVPFENFVGRATILLFSIDQSAKPAIRFERLGAYVQ